MARQRKISLRRRFAQLLVRIRHRVPPGLRIVLGALLIVGGILGALPILGFWMLPLGIAVAALDVTPAWRWISRKARGG